MTYPPAQPPMPQPSTGPVNALMWDPSDLTTGLLAGPRARFVVAANGEALHGIVCGVAARLGLKIRFRADRYKPRKRHVVVAETGSALATSIRGGSAAPHGTVNTAWSAQPGGLILVGVTMTASASGSNQALASTVFPQFALELYTALAQSGLLVWAGTLYEGPEDLAQWRTAPGSPTPQAPYPVTAAGLAQAQAGGWAPEKI